jgi:hypothetical protein
MAKVMLFALHNTTEWWRYIASQLRFASSTVVLSDLPDADINLTPGFYRAFASPNAATAGAEALGEQGCAEVIARCRLLRTLDRTLALRMIGAMWTALEEIVETERPDLLLSFVVDRYLLDLLERILRRRGTRYVGVALAPFPEHVMFMAKGEYLPLREPPENEVDAAVSAMTAPQWIPSYLPHRPRYDLLHFAQLYARFNARWLVFEFLRRWERNPLDYRYLVTWTEGAGFRIRLRDWAVMRHLNPDWRARLEAMAPERRIFVGLQVNPEAAIEYWVRNVELVAYEDVFVRAARVLGEAGYSLFVKDHPSQFGFRQVELIERLSRCKGVTFVPYDVPGQFLVQNCHATFTYTGTVGLQAAMAGRCAVVAAGAYYAYPGGPFIILESPAEIDRLPERIAAAGPAPDPAIALRYLARHVLRACVPGVHTWRGFSPRDDQQVRQTEPLIDSLNEYLPRFLKRDSIVEKAGPPVSAHEQPAAPPSTPR